MSEAGAPGDVTVLAGPSGVGKGTLVAGLRQRNAAVWVSVSATTRAPRPGETDGVDYHFVTDERFDELVGCDGLLEWARYGAARYGTPAEPVLQAVAGGRRAILEIDVQGARQVRTRMPQARFVFIAPPSWDELVRRLRGRGTEDQAQLDSRLAAAADELAAQGEFDAVVVNDEVGRATQELVDLLGL